MFVGKQQEIDSFETSTSKPRENLVNNRKQSDSKALTMKEQASIDFFQSTGDGKGPFVPSMGKISFIHFPCKIKLA